MKNEKVFVELGESLRMIKNSRADCPETSIKGRAIWETAHNCALSCLTNCSTVDAVEVVHGRWKDKQANSIFVWRLECSVCGAEYNTPVGYNYCPNCGAKMDGGINNE